MSKTSVAELMVPALVQAGVKRIYGVVGDSLNGLTESLRRDGTIDWVHVRHEETAAFAAGAEAHLTGSLAVCAGSCGPGNLHLINGLFDAHRSRVPVLAIAAQIPSAEIGRGYFQETHPQTLFRECSHFCELISSPAQLPGVLETAIRVAVAETGSVCLTERELGVNTLGYLPQHLIVLVDPADILVNIHHAYRRPEWRRARYAVFQTGPSATADIEGVLIHGAQGVRSLSVLLLARS